MTIMIYVKQMQLITSQVGRPIGGKVIVNYFL